MDQSENPTRPARRSNGNRRPRRWLPYAGALLLIGLLVAGFWPRPVPVEVSRAAVGLLRATVNEEGKTRIKQRYVVSASVAGQLRRIPFKVGAEVVAGQTVVAAIDPLSPTLLDFRARATAEARRDAAAANLQKSQATHTFASSELRRMEKLFTNKTVSEQEIEAAQMRESSAAKEESSAQSALRQAEAELQEFGATREASTNAACAVTEVKAPASGKVLRIFEENARVVAPGTPLMEIGDPADLEIVVEVLSRDGAAIPPEANVELEQWGGGFPMQGRVRLVEPAAFTKVSALGVEEQRVNVIVDLLTPVEQRRNVGDNFRVESRIIVWQDANALKVPAGALFRQADKWAAFVIADGCAQLRMVEVGRSSGAETQVLAGLKSGEEVILYPGSRVKPGQRVSPVKI